jgi:TonB family protein
MIHLAILVLSATPDAKPQTASPPIICNNGVIIREGQKCPVDTKFESPASASAVEPKLITETVTCPGGELIPKGAVCPDYKRPAQSPSTSLAPPPGPNRRPIAKGNPGSWVTQNDYPMSSIREEASGIAAFTLDISKEGTVSNCKINTSTGDPNLDEATCSNIIMRARFYPATDAQSRPIAGTYSNRVRWVLPDTLGFPASNVVRQEVFPRSPSLRSYGWNYPALSDYPTKAELERRSGISYLDLTIDSAGLVSDCKVTVTSGHVDLDQKSCEIARARARYSPALDIQGKPSAGRISTGVAWSLPQASSLSSSTKYPTAEYKPATEKPLPQKRPKMFSEPGFAEFEVIMKADGTFGECKESGDLFKRENGNRGLCEDQKKDISVYEPYLDAAGRPVAKKVKVRIAVDITDVN